MLETANIQQWFGIGLGLMVTADEYLKNKIIRKRGMAKNTFWGTSLGFSVPIKIRAESDKIYRIL